MERICVPLGEAERGVGNCVCGVGGVGQTARNRGNRGHGVSAEIKRKEETPRKQPRDDGERVGLAWRKKGDGTVGMFWEPHKALVVVSVCWITTLALV